MYQKLTGCLKINKYLNSYQNINSKFFRSINQVEILVYTLPIKATTEYIKQKTPIHPPLILTFDDGLLPL